ncbi:Exportin-4 [Quaeritorhiza haematococci]|nr:Exportin-4 [Quaeritorhiza haematococci]
MLDPAQIQAQLEQACLDFQEAATREYSLHSASDIHALRDFLLAFVLQRDGVLERFVKEQVLQAVAVMVKRGWLDESPAEKEVVFHRVTELLAAPELAKKQIALSLLNALIDEFSTDKASAVGLPWDFHHRCRRSFEEGELRRIFQIILQLLHAFMHGHQQHVQHHPQATLSHEDKAFLGQCVVAAEKVLSWEFAMPNDELLAGTFDNRGGSGGGADDSSSDLTVSTRFPASWREILVRPDVLDLFFQLHSLVLYYTTFSHRSRQCLVQLAGMHGPVFGGDLNAQRAYVNHLLKGFVEMIKNFISSTSLDPSASEDFGPELLGIAQISRRILSNFKLPVSAIVPGFFPFLSEAANLTVSCLKKSNEEEDETWVMEACDEMLDTWAGLVMDTQIFIEDQSLSGRQQLGATPGADVDVASLMSFLEGLGYRIFETYVDVTLERAKAEAESVEEIEDGGFKDQEVYADQLLYISTLARIDPVKSLGRLQQLLDDRFKRLHEVFEKGPAADTGE